MNGWIKSIRESKGLIFVATTNGREDLQLTLKEGTYKLNGELKIGASFAAEGVYSETPKGLKEFVVSDMMIFGKSDDEFPIQPKKHSFDFLRSIPELRGRTKTFRAIWKIRNDLFRKLNGYLERNDFYQYWTPIVTEADCEGAGETFDVKSDWMSEKLTVSGQLHGEIGMMSLGRVYTFGPCFRAEKSGTKKHLSEFWMLEPEAAFWRLTETIQFVEDMLKTVLKSISYHTEEFKNLEIDNSHILSIVDREWGMMRYIDVCEEFGLEFGEDIGTEIEKKLIEKYKVPIFVIGYPRELKPFYMKKKEKVALCFDLIFPEVGELVGGSEREEDYETLKKNMEDAGVDLKKMDWYLSSRKWGSVPHSGFGLGFERLIMFVCKLQKIHDAIPFPVSYS